LKLKLTAILTFLFITVCVTQPNMATADDKLAFLGDRTSHQIEQRSSQNWKHHTHKVLHMLSGDQPSAFLGFEPRMSIAQSPFPNAYIQPTGEITISQGILDLVQSDSELAFVIAHEIGHFLLEHHLDNFNQGQSYRDYQDREIQADLLAIEMMGAVGLNTKSALTLLDRIAKFGGCHQGSSLGQLYPSIQARVEAIEAFTGG